MILEGVSSLRKEFRNYISLGVFVDTPKETCLIRGIQRDITIGTSQTDVENNWHKWFKEEVNYMNRDHPKDYADLIINGTQPFESQIIV
jgi:uridine kinase